MQEDNQYYINHLEWEYSNFPITIRNLEFEKNNWGFDSNTIISIWRDEKFSLRGKISGNSNAPEKLNEEHFIGKGNIIKGQMITGNDITGNLIEIHESFLNKPNTNSLQMSLSSIHIEAELTMDFLKIKFLNKEKIKGENTRLYWFLSTNVDAHFTGSTFRKKYQTRVRIGIDEHNDATENYIGSSNSKDYVPVSIPEVEFILAKVPDVFLPDTIKGLCFEFRNKGKIEEDLLDGLSSFISFLLGNEVFYTGYSFVVNNSLDEVLLHSLNIRHNTTPMPPIRFNRQYEWGDISWLLKQLLPNFLKLKKTLLLDEALSRYWIAKSVPLGSNLPVLASALEIIAAQYLKTVEKYKPEYLSKEKYLNLIETEKRELIIKLSAIEGGEIILNKIWGAYQTGPNEKMNAFFSYSKIEIGDLEKKAIALRNKMAHASRDYSDEERAHDDIVYSRVYEVLFNRIILKLLGYDGYYKDYSMKGCPLKHITKPAGI